MIGGSRGHRAQSAQSLRATPCLDPRATCRCAASRRPQQKVKQILESLCQLDDRLPSTSSPEQRLKRTGTNGNGSNGNGNGDVDLPSQGRMVQEGVPQTAVLERDDDDKSKDGANLDYLQELLAIQQNGAKALGFFGTRNMGFLHQKLIEILSYAMVLTGNHIFTSGGSGTNAAVVKGALRAEQPELLTVILPQSLHKQPEELHELLQQVQDLQEMKENDHLSLLEASQLCNAKIISNVQQIICFAFHDSKVVLQTCQEAREKSVIVTLCYLD